MKFSIMFFSADGEESPRDRYRLVGGACRLADRLGFEAAWFPERHFHRFGGLFPNPAVVAASVAGATSRLRLRAGSVVLPLHDPIRVAEEWSVVDNLSGGRVDLAFATGWDADSFVLAPDRYDRRVDETFERAAVVRDLWRGRTVGRLNGSGRPIDVRLHPTPVGGPLSIWITATRDPGLFDRAGEGGYNILTALLFQSMGELAEKVGGYRRARARAGHDPGAGRVTLMLHTFVTSESSGGLDTAREKMLGYLGSSVDLWGRESSGLAGLAPTERDEVVELACERYLRSSSLIGSLDHCRLMIERARAAGVDEIACLIDFGPPPEEVEASLRRLAGLGGPWPG